MRMAISILSLLFSISAMAADVGELYFQPGQGETVVEPGVGFGRTDTKLDDDKSHSLLGGVTAQAFFGLTENIALRAAWGYVWSNTKGATDNSVSGFTDIQLGLRGRSVQAAGTWRYGLYLNYSPKPMEFEADGTRHNQFSGRDGLFPYVGYELLISETGRLGFSLEREFLLGEEKSEGPGWKGKSKGGEKTTLSAYYECFQEKNNVYGVILAYQWSEDHKGGGVSAEGIDSALLGIYSRYELKDNLYLTPKLNYSRAVNDRFGSSQINRLRGVSLDVGLRFVF